MNKERIACPKCHGDGGFMPLVPTRYDDGIDCDRCNGKGYLIKKEVTPCQNVTPATTE